MLIENNNTNIYYTLQAIELNNLSNLKYRQLKTRIKQLINNNIISIGEKIYKQSNRWYIHYSVVDLFQAKRVHNKKKVRPTIYKTEISINLPANYDKKFYNYLAQQIEQKLKPSKLIYAIEPSPKTDCKYHLHIGTTGQIHRVTQALKAIEKQTLITILDNKNTRIAPIWNLTQFVNYIAKMNQNLVNELKEKKKPSNLVMC